MVRQNQELHDCGVSSCLFIA